MSEVMVKTEEKVPAANSFLLLFEDKPNNKAYNFILPLSHFSTEEFGDTSRVVFNNNFSTMELELKDATFPMRMICDYTDDPTPTHAGSVVSLGYPLIRLDFKQAKIVQYNPLVIEGPRATFGIRFNREQRESLISMPDHPPLSKDYDTDDNSVIRRFHLLSPGFDKPLYIISCVSGKKNYSLVEMLDMTSFYHKSVVIYSKTHKTELAALKSYKELVMKWREK